MAPYRQLSLALGIPGLVLLVVAGALGSYGNVYDQHTLQLAALPVLVLAQGLFIAGLSFYAQAKGRHWTWGFLGLLWIIGLLALLQLENRTSTSSTEGPVSQDDLESDP